MKSVLCRNSGIGVLSCVVACASETTFLVLLLLFFIAVIYYDDQLCMESIWLVPHHV
jgi:hypothetical protein